MKYSDLAPAPKLLVRRKTAAAMLEHNELLERFERAGWIKPRIAAKSRGEADLFAVSDLEVAVNRLMKEHLPMEVSHAA